MQKETLAIQFEFSLEDIRRSLALTTGQAFTDEEIRSQFIDRPPVVIDMEKVDASQNTQMCMVFSILIYADNLDKSKTL